MTSTAQPTMPPPPRPLLPFTLILAATPSLGIGRAGGLPWPSHKADMAFFARVTRRLPKSAPALQGRTLKNAVIMGRKTWDSIPPKFRPLKGRINVVVSRQEGVLGPEDGKGGGEVAVRAGSLESAIELLESVKEGTVTTPATTEVEGSAAAGTQLQRAREALAPLEIGHVFVIGGSSIYKAVLELPQTRRVLLTKIEKEYECDTFFPLNIEGEEGKNLGWVRKPKKKLEEFAGEEIGDRLEDGGVGFEFCMFEKEGVE